MMLPNGILFPHTMLPLYIFEPRYQALLHDSLHSHRLMAIAMTKPGAKREIPCKIAGIGIIRAAVKHDDGTSHVILQGLHRIQLNKAAKYRPYRVHSFTPLETKRTSDKRIQLLREKLVDLVALHLQNDGAAFSKFQQCLVNCSQDDLPPIDNQSSMQNALLDMVKLNDVEHLADLISCTLLTEPYARQMVLEELNLESRLDHLVTFLMAQIFCPRKKKS